LKWPQHNIIMSTQKANSNELFFQYWYRCQYLFTFYISFHETDKSAQYSYDYTTKKALINAMAFGDWLTCFRQFSTATAVFDLLKQTNSEKQQGVYNLMTSNNSSCHHGSFPYLFCSE
jgi:hypothetical protein